MAPKPSHRDWRRALFKPCETPDALHRWIDAFLGLSVPRKPMCGDHQAPFDYLVRSYFEPATDLVVWAPRGGGKTRLAAVATLLDLLHKPGVAVRILGGSLLQSMRMWEHLLPDLERLAGDQIVGATRTRSIKLASGGAAAAIAQSQAAVRGLRIQKLRCDEVELFDPEVLEAAKLTTRSIKHGDAKSIAGTMELLSTLHEPWGLMHREIESAKAAGKPIVKWCVLDVLEKCPPERPCEGCPLWDDCRGRAKASDGFVTIDDAIRLKQRASKEAWEAEMLCRRPSIKGSVFPTFDLDVHVVERVPSGATSLAIDFGFHNPFACLWIVDAGSTVHVIDEYVQSGRTMEEHLAAIEARPWGAVRSVACDPAGNSRNDQTAESNVQLLRRRQYAVKSRRSRIVDGLELIRRGLRTASGEVSLFIHPRCRHLVRAMRGYHYPTDRDSELPLKDGEHDHVVDALRYFFVNRGSTSATQVRVY